MFFAGGMSTRIPVAARAVMLHLASSRKTKRSMHVHVPVILSALDEKVLHSPPQSSASSTVRIPSLGRSTLANTGSTTRTSSIRSLSTPASRALKKASCPYHILGVPKESTYAVVKKSFLKVAMSHHPDVVGELDGDDKKRSVELFMKCRAAFESIVEVEGGMSALRTEVELEQSITKKSKMTDEEFDAWFLNETGHNNPFQFDLDPATMREVADMTDAIGGGLDRDGGMWTLANMVSRSVKGGKEAASVLRLEAGEIKTDEEPVNGLLRRRRRRRPMR